MTHRSKLAIIATALLAALALTLFPGPVSGQRAAAYTLKLGTLAPKSSPWGKVLETWAKAVKEKSGGQLELQIFYNGAQGDEGAMVGKIKSGQLDGAFVSAVGLGKIYKPILALQMPGLFATWAKLDKARNAMKGDFEQGAKDAGFTIVGWGDLGAVRRFSRAVQVTRPDDLKGKKPFMWRDDAIQPVFFQVVGGVTPVPLNIPEVLPNLNTGAIDIVMAPSLVVEQLQWAGKLDTVSSEVSALSIGATVFSAKKLDSLPADLRAIVVDTGKVAASALTARIRNEDDAAYGRLKGKMTVVTSTADDKAKWDTLYKQVRERLKQGTFSADLVTKLEALGQ